MTIWMHWEIISARWVKQLCEQTTLRCRFHVPDLPHEVQVSSQTRHNISLAVKESGAQCHQARQSFPK